jgi:hypothetical protein
MYNIMTKQQRVGLESIKIMTIRLKVEDTEVTTFQKRQNWEGARAQNKHQASLQNQQWKQK